MVCVRARLQRKMYSHTQTLLLLYSASSVNSVAASLTTPAPFSSVCPSFKRHCSTNDERQQREELASAVALPGLSVVVVAAAIASTAKIVAIRPAIFCLCQ